MKRGMIRLAACVPLVILAALAVAPIAFLVTGSVMGDGELRECLGPVTWGTEGFATWRPIPLYPTLRHFVELLLDSPEFFKMFWNTVKITAGVLIGQLLVGVPAAWGLARYPFPGRGAVYLIYVVLMALPFQATMLSQYLALRSLSLLDTLWAVILPGAFSTFSVFIMCRFFAGIPESVIEAARVDGAGELSIFFSVGIPMGSGGILAAMTLQFLECWGMIEQPMAYLKSRELMPLSLYLPKIGPDQAGLSFCASLVAIVPALLVFLAGSDYLERGIAAVAVKE